jgi:beta-glucosidase/6-phospho-beta-glucosidase/beta-galactosidase
MIAATRHDELARRDYTLLNDLGIRTVRDGIRWHLIEVRPGIYNFSSILPMIEAARDTGTQVIWDLCHYGWPDDLNALSPAFVKRFAKMCRAFIKLLKNETDGTPLVCPVNEPSFLSWAGGDTGHINPFTKGCGFDLKCQLIRASIEATEAVWSECPSAQIVQCEPAINIIADPSRPQDKWEAEQYRLFQYQALDMLAGSIHPELGGNPKYVRLLGINYYWNNQWFHNGRTILRKEALYRPFRQLLREFYERYECPLFIAETGNEDHRRAAWLEYVAEEVLAAQRSGVPLYGICLYPILNHPGWDNDRHCYCGLFDYADQNGNREIHEPLRLELARWQKTFETSDHFEYAAS